MDESGFLLIPTRRRTWGPQGQTPVIRYRYRHDRIWALAALSLSAVRRRVGLYVRFQQENFRAVHVAALVRHLLEPLRGPVILLWDGGKIHGGPFIDHVREDFPRLQIERFAAYAPELNPVEQVWGDFKGHSGQQSAAEHTGHSQQASRQHPARTPLSVPAACLHSGVRPAIAAGLRSVTLLLRNSIAQETDGR